MNISNIKKLNSEIENFEACYSGYELYGDRDGKVSSDKFIEYLIEHPEFQQIADRIESIRKSLKEKGFV